MVPAKLLNVRFPDRVIAYYESRSVINKRFEEIEKDRFTATLRPTIISKLEHIPMAEDIEVAPGDEETGNIMVAIPQDFNSEDIPAMIDNNPQEWCGMEEQTS